jgi:hypothetical protein
MTGTVALVALVVAGDLIAATAGTEASASAAQIPVPTSPIPIARALRPAGPGAAPPAREVAPAAREIPRIRSPPFASAYVPSLRATDGPRRLNTIAQHPTEKSTFMPGNTPA